MTTFIKTDRGHINLRCVRSIYTVKVTPKEPHESCYRSRVEYDGEGGERLIAHTKREVDVDSLDAPVIPALPGFFAVALYDDEPREVYRIPIIAWRIEKFLADTDMAFPIGTDELPSGEFGILDPSGTVRVSGGGTYASVEAYRLALIEETRYREALASPPAVPPPPPPPKVAA
jgi:hypothetical protein